MSFLEDNVYLADPFGDGLLTEEEQEEEATLFNSQAKAWDAYGNWQNAVGSFFKHRPCTEVAGCW